MGTKEDHDLLIELRTEQKNTGDDVRFIIENMATEKDITAAIDRHRANDHSRKSLPPASGTKEPMSAREKAAWGLLSALLASGSFWALFL
jgi:hypothetical protein